MAMCSSRKIGLGSRTSWDLVRTKFSQAAPVIRRFIPGFALTHQASAFGYKFLFFKRAALGPASLGASNLQMGTTHGAGVANQSRNEAGSILGV